MATVLGRRGLAAAADRAEELGDALRWQSVRDEARAEGVAEEVVLLDQLARLEAERSGLQAQLDEARSAAARATGRSRAVARQLAELQVQYAAVAGLRDDYLSLQRQLDSERRATERDQGDS